jgi:hypothetical protein
MNPKRLFAFRANMMLREISMDIQEQLNPMQVDWGSCPPELTIQLKELDSVLGRIDMITSKILDSEKE